MHATIPKGFVGGFEFTVFQRNLNHARETMEVCLRVLKKSNKRRSDSYSVKKTVHWLYPILPFGIVACTFVSDDLSRNRCIQEFQVVCTCMIFNHILIFTIKSNSFKKAIRRGICTQDTLVFFSRAVIEYGDVSGSATGRLHFFGRRPKPRAGHFKDLTKIKTRSWRDSGTQRGVPSPFLKATQVG